MAQGWAAAAQAATEMAGMFLNSWLVGDGNRKSQRRQYEYNQRLMQEQQSWLAQQTELQRQYNTEMSNTAHQREVADLRAAGLNPILSVNGGASVPTSGIPSSGLGQVGLTDDAGALNGAVSNMINKAQQKVNEKVANAQIEKTKAETTGQKIENKIKEKENEYKYNELASQMEERQQNIHKIIEENSKIIQETKNEELRGRLIQENINLYNEYRETERTKQDLNKQQRLTSKAQEQNIKAETAMKGKIKKMSKSYNESKGIKLHGHGVDASNGWTDTTEYY